MHILSPLSLSRARVSVVSAKPGLQHKFASVRNTQYDDVFVIDHECVPRLCENCSCCLVMKKVGEGSWGSPGLGVVIVMGRRTDRLPPCKRDSVKG
jgi:hypothetical protein